MVLAIGMVGAWVGLATEFGVARDTIRGVMNTSSMYTMDEWTHVELVIVKELD